MQIRTKAVIAAVALLPLAAACGSDDDDASSAATTAPAAATPTTGTGQQGTIVDVAVAAGDFTTLVKAVQAAGLVQTLSGPGPFTVFAPTDESFADALDQLDLTAEQLLADTAKLKSILTYHVVPGRVPSTAVVTMDGKTAKTVNGADVTIDVNGSTVKVNEATVTSVDVPASNGVIHVIDAVLLPPA